MPGTLPYYEIDFEIDGKEYSINLLSVTIISSMAAVYQTVILSFGINTADVVENKIYGWNNEIKLNIRSMTEDQQVNDEFEVELVVLKTIGGLGNKSVDNSHLMSNKITFVCLPKNPYINMTKFVNYIAENTSQESPYEAAENIINKFIPDVKKEIEDKNKNEYKGENLVVPPGKFSYAIDFLDQNYGIYKGPLFYSCNFYENTLSMWDLSEKIKAAEEYSVYILCGGQKEDESIYKDSGSEENVFYTFSNLNFKLNTGLQITKSGYNNIFIGKSADTLYDKVEVGYDETDDQIRNGEKIEPASGFKELTKYHRNDTLVNYDEAEIKSTLTKDFQNQVETKFSLYRNIRLKNLFRVGIPIKLIPEDSSLEVFQGNYLVKSTVIKLTRYETSQYNCLVDVNIYRNNIEG